MSPTLEFLRPGETKVIILLIGVQIKDLKMKSTTQMHDETDEYTETYADSEKNLGVQNSE